MQVLCGSDIARLCNVWEDMEAVYLLWGAYFLHFACHLVLIQLLHAHTMASMLSCIAREGALLAPAYQALMRGETTKLVKQGNALDGALGGPGSV